MSGGGRRARATPPPALIYRASEPLWPLFTTCAGEEAGFRWGCFSFVPGRPGALSQAPE